VALAFTGVSREAHADPPFVFSGLPISSPELQMNINSYGYSDSALDNRSMFLGREYLSGEWAGGICYEGGTLPTMFRWFPDRFVFPDFYTYDHPLGMPHFTGSGTFTGLGKNSDGMDVFESTISNADLEVRMRYEFRDMGEDPAGRLRLGLAAHSLGGPGQYIPSQRYVFQQTYTFRNLTDAPLTGVKFYQFLHTLHGDWGVYDGRDYGGGMPTHRYGISIQGESLGFNMDDDSTAKFTDTVAMKYSWVPSGFELGPFGMKDTDSHETGEPGEGVHKSIAMNSLNNADSFDPDETTPTEDAWVAGAVSFDMGTIEPTETASIDILFAVNSTYETIAPPTNLVIHDVSRSNGMLSIDFEETTLNPHVGFLLRSSPLLDKPAMEWDPVGVPYFLDVPFVNWRRFSTTIDPATTPNLFFLIQPTIINDP
jgi:hypothetical protein